jgi:hypothetical protein
MIGRRGKKISDSQIRTKGWKGKGIHGHTTTIEVGTGVQLGKEKDKMLEIDGN